MRQDDDWHDRFNDYCGKIGNALMSAAIVLKNENMTDDLQEQLNETRRHSQIMAVALELACMDIAKTEYEEPNRGDMMTVLVEYVVRALEIGRDE